jgi:RHS repeat-associated protein
VLGPEEPIGNRQSEIGNEQTAPGSDVCGATIMSYLYDPEGRRVARLQGGAVVKQCFYDAGGRMIAEADPSGRTLRAEIYGGNRHLATWTPASGGSTFFNHADWLGTERARTKASDGSRCETITSLPFGGGLNAAGPCSNPEPGPNHFTGKERDAESGLDYFGARHSASALGRFMSADPSNLSADFWLPQTWNRYPNSLNNPLTLVDRNGVWPTYIHDEIINEAFPGMSSQDLKILQEASHSMDYGPGQQSAVYAFEHGMRNGLTGQTPSEAEQRGDQFISMNEGTARRIQAEWIASGHTGFAPGALTAFGNALHTITDRPSPPHAGYQPWYGQPWWYPSGLWHGVREFHISLAQREAAVSAARGAFRETFGFRWSNLDILELQFRHQREEATSRICPNGRFDDKGRFICE